MSDLERLASKRLDKTPSNLKVKPVDLLRAAAHDIEAGTIKCDAVLVLFAHCPEAAEEPWIFDTYRAGMARDREVVLLTLALERTVRQWREG